MRPHARRPACSPTSRTSTRREDLGGSYPFRDSEKCIINPGSVGQPRDRDPRASYAILHDDRIEFVRLDYDIRAVIDKISKINDLSDFLGQRLLEGR